MITKVVYEELIGVFLVLNFLDLSYFNAQGGDKKSPKNVFFKICVSL